MKRPNFQELTSYEEFQSYYWYLEELKQICKELKIDDSGNKKDLNFRIKAYFEGTLVEKKKPKKRLKTTTDILTPSTKLLECGFVFNQKFRDFFAEQTGSSNFKFYTDMVATVKKVKQDEDWDFTLQDLLDVYYGTKEYAKNDASSCQWNQFLKDFCADPHNSIYSPPLKAASILWGIVRDSTQEKVYTRALVEEHESLLKDYRKEVVREEL